MPYKVPTWGGVFFFLPASTPFQAGKRKAKLLRVARPWPCRSSGPRAAGQVGLERCSASCATPGPSCGGQSLPSAGHRRQTEAARWADTPRAMRGTWVQLPRNQQATPTPPKPIAFPNTMPECQEHSIWYVPTCPLCSSHFCGALHLHYEA